MYRMKYKVSIAICIFLFVFSESCKKNKVTGLTLSSGVVLDSISDSGGYTYIATPKGNGPFPAVLYNHGGLGTQIGGDLRATAIALAESGYLARSEKRKETTSFSGHLDEVEAALDDLISNSNCNSGRVGAIGFSRGGLLALQVGKSRASDLKVIISMAPAQANGQLDNTLNDVSLYDDPILILVTTNDIIQDDHVQLAQMAYDSLTNNGGNVAQNIYPYYDSNDDGIQNTPPDDGHELFWKIQDPYWSDVISFLNSHL